VEIVILAGGMGHRFGGIKQFTPVGPDGATLLEVTLADARQAGCDHVVIVTAPGQQEQVWSLFDARPIDHYNISVVPQRPDDLPINIPVERTKPWGTAHALWAARNSVTGPFLLFNADDHYGPNAPRVLAAALEQEGTLPAFAMLGYPLGSTLSKAGTVSRAICETHADGMLSAMREYPVIDARGCIAEGNDSGLQLPLTAPVSMNAWAFTPEIFPLLETYLTKFLARGNLEHDECFLPAAIDDGVRSGTIKVKVVTAPDRWCGMTWPEDRERVARRLLELAVINQAAAGFGLDGSGTSPVPFGEGLINTIWRLDTPVGPRLLQRLNANVFSDPKAIAENAKTAATRVNNALHRLGDTNPRHRLVYLDGPGNHPWFIDDAGGVWRCLIQIPNARPANPTSSAEVRGAARALGRFPGLVTAGEGPELKEVLSGFHDTPSRLVALLKMAKLDPCIRLADCRKEVDRLCALAELAGRLPSHSLPTRSVHNDAKLDNVLVDADSGEALCVIDLDTTMPGLAPHDFGDLVRTAVTGRPEDEPDLELVVVRETVFENLATGYLSGAHDWLTEAEKVLLVDGALVITYEQALRFLADHLAGDVYYRIDMPRHNLQRTRAQLKLLEELLAVEDNLRQIIAAI
jgi:hypothetical protein